MKPFSVLVVLYLLLYLFISNVYARKVDNIDITAEPNGYRITFDFLTSLRYQSYVSDDSNKEFRVQLRPVNFESLTEEEIASLSERVSLSYDYTTGIPLEEIIFEGGDPENPQLTFLFSEEVAFSIEPSVIPREFVVIIKLKHPVSIEPENEIEIPDEIIPDDEEQANLAEEARMAMIENDYNRAIQLYTKIINTSDGEIKKQSQELLGLARERNGQIAHAKAEYERYIQQYPDGPDAARVRQRLAGLITAAQQPKAPLRERRPSALIEKKLQKWDTRIYGRLSQFYYYDQSTLEGEDTQVNRSDFRTDLDFNTRWTSDGYDMLFQYYGSYTADRYSSYDGSRLSKLSFSLIDKENDFLGRIGRQTRTSGGVYGRFDGIHLSKGLTDEITFNSVFGYPVENSRQMYLNTDRKFYSVSLDFGPYKDKWNFTTFFTEQENHGIADRQAIGTELRYFDQSKSFFNLIDYDTMFNELNIFLFNGYLNYSDKTTFNFIFDYRRSPFLTTNNSIIGQLVSDFSDLSGIYSESELRELALDRSPISKSMTFGVTRKIKKDFQLTGEITLSELEGTPSSGGVEAISGTGTDVSYLIQSVFSGTFMERDTLISSFRYSQTNRYDAYSINCNGRFPVSEAMYVNPRLRFDYRDGKNNSLDRISVRPSLRINYELIDWLRFDLEGGLEWMDYRNSDIAQRSTEFFISAGLHLYF